jgi:DNA-directed RNA polymerase subunit RPC12/RpoP
MTQGIEVAFAGYCSDCSHKFSELATVESIAAFGDALYQGYSIRCPKCNRPLRAKSGGTLTPFDELPGHKPPEC